MLSVPERAADQKIRFGGARMMQFVIDNAISETISTKGSVLLTLDESRYIILLPFARTLKRNAHEDIRSDLRHIQQSMQRYPVESVRSWVLHLITELELKYTVMQHFVSNFNAEQLHRSVYAIDTLDHLKEWIINFLMRKMVSMQSLRKRSVIS